MRSRKWKICLPFRLCPPILRKVFPLVRKRVLKALVLLDRMILWSQKAGRYLSAGLPHWGVWRLNPLLPEVVP